MTTSGRTRARLTIATVLIATSAAFGLYTANTDQRAVEASPSADHRAEAAARDRFAIAEYARTHGLSGLSPAGLTAIADPADLTNSYAELAAIADYARAHGLSGLSPAGLSPITD